MSHNENGRIVYHGPSALNGQPIVAIVTGLKRPARNPKTGPMLQLWILPAGQLSPLDARAMGHDASFCGDCPIKSGCYVEWKNAPTQVWRCWKAGRYLPFNWEHDARYMRGKSIRLGACGEPVAVPYSVVRDLVALCSGHTGYTHAWPTRRFWRWRHLVMASVESADQAREAQSRGWRTFRIGDLSSLPSRGQEVACPASAESGHKTTCSACTLCAGASRTGRNVLIRAHGNRVKLAKVLQVIQ
jgi:hypothetical protein